MCLIDFFLYVLDRVVRYYMWLLFKYLVMNFPVVVKE